MTRASRALALCNATVIADPEARPVPERTVLVAGDTIAAVVPAESAEIPAAAEILDCSGCTVVSGFWNCHVHFFERKWENAENTSAEELQEQLEDFTRYGYTTVCDLSSSWPNTLALRARIERGIAGPRIFSTGEGLIPRGGLPPAIVLRILGLMDTPMPEVAHADEARNAVRTALANGVDGIKVFVSSQTGGTLAPDLLRAAVETAHADQKPVFAHVNGAVDVEAAVRAGADVIAHTTPATGTWSDGLIGEMLEAGAALTPTIALWEHLMRHDRISIGRSAVDIAVEQLHRWSSAGGTVLFGTDYGAVPADPSREYATMRDAGMTFGRILDALTAAPSRRFGAFRQAEGNGGRYGRVAEGFAADLVALKGDPCANLSALTQVRYTVRRGEIVYRG